MSQNHFHFLGVNSWILETFWETLKRLENPWKPLTESWRKNFGCLGCKPCWTGHVGRPYNDPGWKPRVCTLWEALMRGGVSLSRIDLQDIHIRKRATPILTLRETLCDPKKGQWTIFWKCQLWVFTSIPDQPSARSNGHDFWFWKHLGMRFLNLAFPSQTM